MVASWDEMIDVVGRAPGLFVGRPKYSLVRSYVEGFGDGRGDDVLDRFQRWIRGQPQHASHRNYSWPSLILDEVFPDRRPAPTLPTLGSDEGWPRPPAPLMSEDDLDYPAEDQAAIGHLFDRLRQFLDSEPPD